MTFIDTISADLEDDEGRIKHAYLDSEGFITIGVGFLIDERKGGGLDDEEIDFILAHRIKKKMAELDARLPQWNTYPENARRAVLNMAYQLGVSGLLAFRKTIAALDAGDYAKAADEALDSRWAKQTPNRATKVTALMREGK